MKTTEQRYKEVYELWIKEVHPICNEKIKSAINEIPAQAFYNLIALSFIDEATFLLHGHD